MANHTGKGYFEKSNKKAKGGPRPNSGRRPNWLKDACDRLLYEKGGIQKIARMAGGEAITLEFTDENGKKSKRVLLPELKDIREATEFLADRAHGKPTQEVEHKNAAPPIFDIYIKGVKQ